MSEQISVQEVEYQAFHEKLFEILEGREMTLPIYRVVVLYDNVVSYLVYSDRKDCMMDEITANTIGTRNIEKWKKSALDEYTKREGLVLDSVDRKWVYIKTGDYV